MKTARILFPVFLVSILILPPVFVQAQSGLVPPCSNITRTIIDDNSTNPPTTKTIQVCTWGFNELMALINTLIKFALFDLSVPIAAIMFAYAGILMVASGGSTESRSKAKSIATNTLIGFVFALAAYLIIKTILHIAGYGGSWIGF